MKRERDDIDRLLSLLDAAADRILRIPDDEVRAELAEDGKRPGETVEEIIRRHLTAFRKRKLQAAKLGAERARAAQAAAAVRLPGDPAFRRALLDRIVANDPERVPKELTVAYREGKERTDAEVDSAIRALMALGLLDDQGRIIK